MSSIIRVSSVTEAIDLAEKWKQEGKFDLFRGQNKNWELIASLNRGSLEERKKATERSKYLWGYFQLKPYLKEYVSNVHVFSAIAQHYGIPTQYVDFTHNPKVAAFFATYKKRYTKPEEGVILCVNSSEFKEFIQFCSPIFEKQRRENPRMEVTPEVIKIDVANLWRLEAQEGCFLYLPYRGFEKSFGAFDRIIFPYQKPCENRKIYIPEIKSLLEEDIDQYFDDERAARRWEIIKKEMKAKIRTLPYSTYVKQRNAFLRVKSRCKSWSTINRKKWLNIPAENFSTVSQKGEIKLSLNIDEKSFSLKTYQRIVNIIHKDNSIRNHEVYFNFILSDSRRKKLHDELSEKAGTLWNIIRRLPYSNSEISQSISNLIQYLLSYHRFEHLNKNSDRHNFFSQTMEESALLEYGWKSGPTARAYVPGIKLRQCLRTDILNVVNDDFHEILKSPVQFLMYCNEPHYLFDFNKLNHLFITDILPNQIFLGGSDNIVFNSISKIERFGIA